METRTYIYIYCQRKGETGAGQYMLVDYISWVGSIYKSREGVSLTGRHTPPIHHSQYLEIRPHCYFYALNMTTLLDVSYSGWSLR